MRRKLLLLIPRPIRDWLFPYRLSPKAVFFWVSVKNDDEVLPLSFDEGGFTVHGPVGTKLHVTQYE